MRLQPLGTAKPNGVQNCSFIFSIQSGTVVVSGLTVSNGAARFGGGINNNATLTLNECVVEANFAMESGGGTRGSCA